MPRFCAHLGYLFTELPLAERFQAARAAGFHAVEHPNPHAFGVNRFRDAAAAAGLAVAQISAPSGDAENGEKGFACLNERTDDFRASVAVGIKVAVEIANKILV